MVKSLGGEEGDTNPEIVNDISEVPIVPLMFTAESPITEQVPVKPMKEPQERELTVREAARLTIKDLGMMFAEGIRETVNDSGER